MPFEKGNKAGRPKGSKNKWTDVQKDLVMAWDRFIGPSKAEKIIKAAYEEAVEGKEIISESADGQTMTKKTVRSFDGLKTILPFVARKMPDTLETPDLKDSNRMVLVFPSVAEKKNLEAEMKEESEKENK